MDMVIVGAGVIGSAVCNRCVRAGADVMLVDAGEIGQGTSAASFAVNVSTRKTPRGFFDLALQARAEHEALALEFGDAPWLHPTGILEWGATPHDRDVIRERVRRIRAWGYEVEWLSDLDARELEPDVVFPTDALIAHYPREAWYDPEVMAATLARDAGRRGAVVRSREAVVAISATGDNRLQVALASGEHVKAPVVVNCAGAAAAQVASLAGVSLPLVAVPGLIVVTTPTTVRLTNILTPTHVNMRSDGGGRLRLHSYASDRALQREDTDDVAARLLQTASRTFTQTPELGLDRALIGVRPIPADGLPILGTGPSGPGLYNVVTHSGAHLAPAIAKLVTDDLLGAGSPALETFRLTRFDEGAERSQHAVADESFREMAARLAEHATGRGV